MPSEFAKAPPVADADLRRVSDRRGLIATLNDARQAPLEAPKVVQRDIWLLSPNATRRRLGAEAASSAFGPNAKELRHPIEDAHVLREAARAAAVGAHDDHGTVLQRCAERDVVRDPSHHASVRAMKLVLDTTCRVSVDQDALFGDDVANRLRPSTRCADEDLYAVGILDR